MTDSRSKTTAAIISAVFVLFILSAMFLNFGLFPFGEKTLSWCDMDQQVVPILADMKNPQGWIFNTGNAGGMGFLGVIFFFTFSPFSAIAALFKASDMMLAVNVIVIVKIAVCAVTASLFFSTFFKKLSGMYNVLFSVMYALCGYSLMMYQILSWLDTMYLFPLLLISMRYMYKKGNAILYTLCLTAIIVTCFYLSYMVVLFIIFSSFICLWAYGEERKGKYALSLGIGTVSAILLSMPVLGPSIMQYLGSARGDNIFEAFIKNTPTNHYETKVPYLMCAAIVLPCLVMYVAKKSADPRRKKVLTALLLAFAVPIFFEKVNMAWQTFSYQAFPMRYGYMVVLIMLSVCAAVFEEKEEAEGGKVNLGILGAVIGTVVAAVGVWFSYKILKGSLDTLSAYSHTLWGNAESFKGLAAIFLIFAAVYAVLLLLRSKKMIAGSIFCVLLVIFGAWESYFNSSVYIGSTANSVKQYKNAITAMEELAAEDIDGFYRVKCNKKIFDVNWVGAAGLNSLGHYTSLTDEDYLKGIKRLGYSGYWMEIGSHGATLFTDSLFCNKYVLKAYPNYMYTAYENPWCMPLGVVAETKVSDYADYEGNDRFATQELVASAVFGKEGLVTRYSPVEPGDVGYAYGKYTASRSSIFYEIDVTFPEELYFDLFNAPSNRLTESINDSVSVYVNGECITSSYPTKSENGILSLGEFENTTVKIEIRLKKTVNANSFGVAGIKTSDIGDMKNSATFAELTVGTSSVKGTVTSEKDGELFLAIPYSEGFSAVVNGEKVEVSKAFGCFTAIPVKAGDNDITVKYTVPGLKAGIVLFIVGAVIFVLYVVLFLPKREKLPKALTGTANVLYKIVFWGFAALIYFIPVAITLMNFLNNFSK